MNLLKKGIFTLFIIGLIASCEVDKEINPSDEDAVGKGLTEITFSSFEAASGPDENGLEDGTYFTVVPLAIGVTSYSVDFGNGETPVTIGAGESASYDYPNEVKEATYTITVVAKADGLESVTKTEDILVEHEVTAVMSAPDSPTEGLEEVLSIYSNGIEYDGAFISYRYKAGGVDFAKGSAQQGEVTMESGNKVMQYSRLSTEVAASIGLDDIVVADAFGSGVAATHLYLDVHSDFAVGIDKLKLVLVNGATEYDYSIDLVDGEWISLDLDLATDFSEPVIQFNEIKFELGTEGMAKDAATLNIDNVYLSKPITSVILNGAFDAKTDHWRFTAFTDGTTTPFGSSSDGSWTNYDGTSNGSKTPGAKWTASQSGGYLQGSGSRYAYQALKLMPNTDYVLEYEYAIKSDEANDPIGGRSIVGLILDEHYIDGADAVKNLGSNLGNHVGTIAEGKFSDTRGTLVQIPFTTNDSGEVAVMFYAVTSVDAWIDNVKVYQD
ncbi:PKD domain-containing protein [Labilibacter marinus]|uniref:PKD domain-containing protein n=1 Tax=Labilibacter marinus TaxID=1477105 RepID=UPI001179ABB7|nr:PKD domain-containing protein [Labilibacter marinus]